MGRPATILAASLEVHCPHCGEPLPNPTDGSHLWMPDDVLANTGAKICNACDEPFQLSYQKRVLVIDDGPMREPPTLQAITKIEEDAVSK